MKKLIGIATAEIICQCRNCCNKDVLNVRENPTMESKVVGKLLNGNKIDVLNTENGWSKITLDGKDAFVSTEFTKASTT